MTKKKESVLHIRPESLISGILKPNLKLVVTENNQIQ